MTKNVGKLRLALNAVGCVGFLAVCLPACFSLAFGLAGMTPPRPDDPDGDKVVGLYVTYIGICGVLAAAALVSLARTVKAWRGHAAPPAETDFRP